MYHKIQRKTLTCVKVNDCQVRDEVRRVVRLHRCSVWRRGGAVPVSVYHSPVKVSSHHPWIKHQWPWRSAARNWNLSSERSCSVEIEWENICLSSSASLSFFLFLFKWSHTLFRSVIMHFPAMMHPYSFTALAEASEYRPRPLQDQPDHSRWLSRWEGPIRNRTPLATTRPWPCRVNRTLPGDGNSI